MQVKTNPDTSVTLTSDWAVPPLTPVTVAAGSTQAQIQAAESAFLAQDLPPKADVLQVLADNLGFSTDVWSALIAGQLS